MKNSYQNNFDNTFLIEIKGLVQGVGFRPFIYRLAKKNNFKGCVENRTDGVYVKINCEKLQINNFIKSIRLLAPVASNIFSIEYKEIEFEYFADFQIVMSKSVSDNITDISPDIAVCDDCLEDMKIQKNRIDYPFINCTNCGPRFTIIDDLPYDREKTSMKVFEMCSDCNQEYTDVTNRRFHAQPIACSVCGPEYTLFYNNQIIKDQKEIISKVITLLNEKKIILIKGLGGFFFACDALCEETVNRLRKLKSREGKPFAVMFSDINKLKEYAFVDEDEEKLIQSWRKPIVLLKQKKSLAFSVTMGLNTIGAMLPYMPFHYLIFEKSALCAIVLTSGNVSDEPIVIDNKLAHEKFSELADAVLIYNREIFNRTDDSVSMIVNKKERILRRSRGYVPTPIHLKVNVDGILATGAELVNCFCMGKENQAILSQHIGDLKNIETYEFYEETIEQYKKLFRFNPSIIVSDLHPNYFSTRYASGSEHQHLMVQHHHAHVASCMAEHGIDEKVIGVSFDGTGLGDDNNLWGGEFFVCDLMNYSRITHFEYIPMPGGDKVTDEPWRMAVSYLYTYFGIEFLDYDLLFVKNESRVNVEMLCKAIDKKINCPLSSSSGRLFDAVAALINLCTHSIFHAEAPMRLESIIDRNIVQEYAFNFEKIISFKTTFQQILDDIKNNVSQSVIATKFHNTIVKVIHETVKKIRAEYDLNKVVISGGTFQNKYLLEKTENVLLKNGFEIFSQEKIPTNDGGISLGQMTIVAKRRQKSKDLF